MDQAIKEKDHSLCNKDQISEPQISLHGFILSSYLGTKLKSSNKEAAHPV